MANSLFTDDFNGAQACGDHASLEKIMAQHHLADAFQIVIDPKKRLELMLRTEWVAGSDPIHHPTAKTWWVDTRGIQCWTHVGDYLAVWDNLNNPLGPIGRWRQRTDNHRDKDRITWVDRTGVQCYTTAKDYLAVWKTVDNPHGPVMRWERREEGRPSPLPASGMRLVS